MLLRRKSDDWLVEARLTPHRRIGRHRDPAVEVYTEGVWYRLRPADMADGFEIVAATGPEMDQMALLVEYDLEFAADFALAEAACLVP